MIQFFFLRLPLAGILSVIVFFHVSRKDKEERLLFQEGTVKYRPFAYTLWLPAYMAVYYVFDTLQAGMNTANRTFFSVCFMIFLHIAVYYALLLVLLPWLRKMYDPHTCALLWILPSLLYIIVLPYADFATKFRPLLIIPAPLQLVKILCAVWAIGFLAVFFWKITVHFRFRKWISENSVEITDPEILRVWKEEQQATGIYPLLENPLLCCPLIKTPLSVGMWKDSTLLALPDRPYTPEELSLIFRHEIIHIQCQDSTTKFFLVFCTALCWFNPLMWKAMRKSADDMELSCDEAVLRDAEPPVRHQYAKLILETAGDERGFTTCLSADASALHYRLTNIITPHPRRSGRFLAAAITILLLISIGYVSLSYEQTTAGELVRQNGFNTVPLSATYGSIDGQETEVRFADSTEAQDLLRQIDMYLQDIPAQRLTGSYYFSDFEDGSWLTVHYHNTSSQDYYLTLTDEKLHAGPSAWQGDRTEYHIPQEIDWDYINSLMDPL